MKFNEIQERQDKLESVSKFATAQKAIHGNIEIACNMLGLTSKSQLYDVLSGKWENISARKFDAIARMCGVEKTWAVVETSNYQRIKGAMLKAANHGDLNALCGDTGTGKTQAAKTLCKILPNALYVMGDVTMTRRTFMQAILKSLTPTYFNYRSMQAQMSAVCDLLCKKTCPVLVIDDAGKLKENVLALMQVIYDRTKGNAGILMLGTEGLYQKIAQHSESNKYFMRELNARITWGFLDYVPASEISKICKNNGINDESAITWMTNAIVSLHTLENIIKDSKILSERSGKNIDSHFLSQMNKNTKFFKPETLNFKNRLKVG